MREGGRRYRIQGLLGEGGFGRVYRATLEDDQGFVKDVAVKIGASDAPEAVLKRFRDEARILGLVRDRAIVAVEPPTRLGDRWAVVMEFIDGASLQEMLAARGKLPARVALGIVQEVARALDSIYSAPGPKGAPLNLVHRDLKPANLQLTRSGEVKILDFGLARAAFAAREADSTTNIGGTLGYIAPERLEGMEGPTGDVYSLGIVLRTALTGVGPRRWRKFEEEGSTIKDKHELLARGLAEDMVQLEPEQRPTAREVERRCEELVAQMRGPTLRDWCTDYVRPTVRTKDRLVGSVLSETLAMVPMGIEDSQNLVRGPSSRSVLLAATFGSLGTGLVAAVALVLGIAVLWWVGTGKGPIRVAGTELADVLPTKEPPPIVIEVPEPAVVEEPEVAPQPVAPKALPVSFESDPPGAEVSIDGQSLGTAPLNGELVLAGEHTLRFVFGFEAIEAKIVVGPKRPRTYLWEVGEPLQVSY